MNIKRTNVVEAPSRDYIPTKALIHRETADARMDKINEKAEQEESKKLEKQYYEENRRAEIADKQQDKIAKERKMIQIRNTAAITVMENIMYQIYRNALVLDESFIKSKDTQLKEYFTKRLQEEPSVTDVMNQVNTFRPQIDSKLITSIMDVAKETATMVLTRLNEAAKDSAISADALNFELIDEEKEKMNEKLQDLSIDEVSELVKKKVVTVIADEKKAAAEQEENIKKAEEELVDSEDVKSEEDLQEALSLMYSQQEVHKEYSIFGAFMHRAYKNLLENAETEPVQPTEPEDEEPTEVEFTDDDVEPVDTGENSDIADKALAEAICEYTVLETLSTLKLVKYSYKQLKEMAFNIAYGK